MCVDVGFDCFDVLKVCGIDVSVGDFDAALLFEQGDKVYERKAIEGAGLKKIVTVLGLRCAIIAGVVG
jgi:hypothetical protein